MTYTQKVISTSLMVAFTIFAMTLVMPTTTHAQTSLAYTGTLYRGVPKTADVIKLQTSLRDLGFYTKAIDGDYGSGTVAAVVAFQKAKGLVADGIVGKGTIATLNANLGASKASTASLTVSASTNKEFSATAPVSQFIKSGSPSSSPSQSSSSESCLEVVSTYNETKIRNVSPFSQVIGEFEIENNCDEDVDIEEIDFAVASSYAKAQFDDIIVKIEGSDFDDTVDTVETGYSSQIGGNALTFNASGSYEIQDGDTVEVHILADVTGLYNPWIGSPYQSTAFSVAIEEVQHSGIIGQMRPVWGNLNVVNYTN